MRNGCTISLMSESTEISILSNVKHLVWQFTMYNVLNMLQKFANLNAS